MFNARRRAASALASFAFAAALAGAATAQSLPPGVFPGAPDYKQAPAGAYALDPAHAAVIARVSHIGYSYSVFRFDKVKGELSWNPAVPGASKLSATVQTASIATNVPGFAKELAGKDYLNAAAYPQARFVSTAFHQIDALHGRVDGQFTLMGKSRPLTFDVALVGAGKGFMGSPRMGVHAEAVINPTDFGLPAMFGPAITLVIDTEFARSK
jgi:polyisoprenoid-binding protein YceI